MGPRPLPQLFTHFFKMLKRSWEKWKLIAEKIGNFQTNLIFSILYFLLVVPVSLVVNIFNDFLGVKKFPEWSDFEDNSETLNKLRDQF